MRRKLAFVSSGAKLKCSLVRYRVWFIPLGTENKDDEEEEDDEELIDDDGLVLLI